jgi:Ca2+/Na+ antiporter
MLLLAAGGWYAAARVGVGALSAGRTSPGRRAIAYLLPTAAAVLVALIARRPEIAVGVIFAGSVACLTLVLGIVTLAARGVRMSRAYGPGFDVVPLHNAAGGATLVRRADLQPTPERRRVWAFILPVAIIALLIGFRGRIEWLQAFVLMLQGLALLHVWDDRSRPRSRSRPAGHANDVEEHAGGGPTLSNVGGGEPLTGRRVTLLVLAGTLALVAAWAAVAATRDLSAHLGLPGGGLVAALMLGPALVLPMIGSASSLAHDGHFDEAVDSQVGFVLLNLCVLLPLASVVWQVRPAWEPVVLNVESAIQRRWVDRSSNAVHTNFTIHNGPTTAPDTSVDKATATNPSAPASTQEHRDERDEDQEAMPKDVRAGLPYPLGVWRIDTVLLVALGFFLLPVALGRWSLGRAEGYSLLVAYTIYMGMTAAMAR